MIKRDTRLIHRVAPYEHEMFDGFLARVTERNHLLAAPHLLEVMTGHKTSAIAPDYIPGIAYYTRTTIEEIGQLSGIEKHIGNGERVWQVAGEWVSKSSFISMRRGKACALCLADSEYVRGLWCLSFYNACAVHDIFLLDRCPACNKFLKWNRRRARYCGCGFDLAQAPVSTADGYQLLVAKIMAHRTNSRVVVDPSLLGHRETSRLMELSLDGLCRTIWFLGHCVSELRELGMAHGLKKPRPVDAEGYVFRACDLIANWPDSLGVKLQEAIHGSKEENPAYFIKQVLKPATHYLHDAIDTNELSFLRLAYEQYLGQLSKSVRIQDIRERGYQLQLDFD